MSYVVNGAFYATAAPQNARECTPHPVGKNLNDGNRGPAVAALGG
jgi:hypothetical protein